MLHVSYENRIGYCTLTSQDKQNKWKLWFCHANCLCSLMYFYKKVDEESGKKEDMVQLHTFYADVKHFEKCVKAGYLSDYSNFHFYAKELDKDLWKMVQLLVKNGIKVTIE